MLQQQQQQQQQQCFSLQKSITTLTTAQSQYQPMAFTVVNICERKFRPTIKLNLAYSPSILN